MLSGGASLSPVDRAGAGCRAARAPGGRQAPAPHRRAPARASRPRGPVCGGRGRRTSADRLTSARSETRSQAPSHLGSPSAYAVLSLGLFRCRGAEAVFDFIEGWYNTKPRHSPLDYDSSIEYERRHSTSASRPENGFQGSAQSHDLGLACLRSQGLRSGKAHHDRTRRFRRSEPPTELGQLHYPSGWMVQASEFHPRTLPKRLGLRLFLISAISQIS